MKITTWMMEDNTAPHMNVAMAIPATAPAPNHTTVLVYSMQVSKWLGGVVVSSWTSNSEVVGSSPTRTDVEQ